MARRRGCSLASFTGLRAGLPTTSCAMTSGLPARIFKKAEKLRVGLPEPKEVIVEKGAKVDFNNWFGKTDAGKDDKEKSGPRQASQAPAKRSKQAEATAHQMDDDDDDDDEDTLDVGEGFVWIDIEAASGSIVKGQEIALSKGDVRMGDRAIHPQSDGTTLCVKRL